jgi:hypothetical protein
MKTTIARLAAASALVLLSGCTLTEQDQRIAVQENAASIKNDVTIWTGMIEYPRNSWERMQREECLRVRCLEPSRGPLLDAPNTATHKAEGAEG